MRNKIASRAPLLALAALCALSFGVRAAWIGLPCHGSCQTANAHILIFDERYYVNAARVIAGIRPAAIPGAAYRHAPLGGDPNAEHPQLAKLIMAGSIELLGDGPWAWRLGSLIFGTLAILGMFALVRWSGGGPWLAVGAAALMASDNLMLVQGRIATLEIYVVAAMVWSVALYVRGRPISAGVVAGIGACMKLFALDVVVVLAVLELARWRTGVAAGARAVALRLAGALGTMAGSFIGLLAVLDQIAPPYDNAARRFVSDGPFGHLWHMISYGSHQTGLTAAHGIASRPWQWLGDFKPIPYLTIDPAHPGGLKGDHPAVHFLGFISPPILLAGLVGTAVALWATARGRGQPAYDGALLRLAAAWFLGTFGPFLIAGDALNRTTYLYYMAIVMPGMYVAAAWLARRLWNRRWLVYPWLVLVATGAIVLYPVTPLP
ncbi:MAG TPA: phospholipid carrier-dependent glycosyltransferase [Solirubrobacteraceae bacterium]|jgi:4-amino-4-deoxy-L-arabinose transferase-like glycosyltransferase